MTPPRSFFFVQISDLQFGMYEPGARAYWETPLVERAVARINALGPAFVICTGDVVDLPGSDRQYDAAQDLLAGIDPHIPLHVVPGNHDIGDAPTEDGIAWYRRRIGPDRFSFDHDGWHFTGLDSCLIADATHVPGEARTQLSWLEDDLAQAGDTPVMVFMHHPLFLDTVDEADHYFNLSAAARASYVRLFTRHRVEMVLAGHLHRNNIAADGGLTVVATGPVGMPLGDGVSGLRILKVAAGNVEHGYFGLEDAAGQSDFVARD